MNDGVEGASMTAGGRAFQLTIVFGKKEFLNVSDFVASCLYLAACMRVLLVGVRRFSAAVTMSSPFLILKRLVSLADFRP